jgi:hypothetical protein
MNMARIDRIVHRQTARELSKRNTKGRKWHVPSGRWWRLQMEDLRAQRANKLAAASRKLVEDIVARRKAAES